MNSLQTLGWNVQLQSEYVSQAANLTPARVVAVDRDSYLVAFNASTPDTQQRVSLAGRLRHVGQAALAVGDWVGIHDKRIDYIFTRRSSLVRKRVGESSEEQLIAANVDWTLIATSLNDDFSPRRVERFIIAAWDAGTTPIILLTKCDMVTDVGPAMDSLAQVAAGCEVLAISALDGTGIGALRQCIGAGETAVLVGSSGVGKSTLINALVGMNAQTTAEVREVDAKGRHTTTRRELLLIPDTGGLIIDTPGIREFGVVSHDEGSGLERSFPDIDGFVAKCRFRDCGHQSEPGCAVRRAVELGELSNERLESFFKLERELAYNERRHDEAKQRQEGKKLSALIRQHTKLSHK